MWISRTLDMLFCEAVHIFAYPWAAVFENETAAACLSETIPKPEMHWPVLTSAKGQSWGRPQMASQAREDRGTERQIFETWFYVIHTHICKNIHRHSPCVSVWWYSYNMLLQYVAGSLVAPLYNKAVIDDQRFCCLMCRVWGHMAQFDLSLWALFTRSTTQNNTAAALKLRSSFVWLIIEKDHSSRN